MINLNNIAYYFINYKSKDLKPAQSRFFLASRIFLGIFTLSISEWVARGLKDRVKCQKYATKKEDFLKGLSVIISAPSQRASHIDLSTNSTKTFKDQACQTDFTDPKEALRTVLKDIPPFNDETLLEGFLFFAERLTEDLQIDEAYRFITEYSSCDDIKKYVESPYNREMKECNKKNQYANNAYSFKDTAVNNTYLDATIFTWVDGTKIILTQSPSDQNIAEFFKVIDVEGIKQIIGIGPEWEADKAKIYDYYDWNLPEPSWKIAQSNSSKDSVKSDATTEPEPSEGQKLNVSDTVYKNGDTISTVETPQLGDTVPTAETPKSSDQAKSDDEKSASDGEGYGTGYESDGGTIIEETTPIPKETYGYEYASRSHPYGEREEHDHWVLELFKSETDKLTIHRFPKWLDHTPTKPEELLKFCQEFHQSLIENNNTLDQLLIHCSAGIGRTGVVATVLIVYFKMLEAREKGEVLPMNAFQILLYLRAFRSMMVKSAKEFELLIQTIKLIQQA